MNDYDKNKHIEVQDSVHVPVLLHEIVDVFGKEVRTKILNFRIPNSNPQTPTSKLQSPISNPFWYLDGTLGGAGHALAIAKKFHEITGDKLNIIGFDRDIKAIERANELLKDKVNQLVLVNDDYRNLEKVLNDNNISKLDFILLDLGISSDELDNSGKGFTFLKDEPLFMTMGDPKMYPFTALDIVNSWKEEDIANVIFGYGEDRYARRIARAIIIYREKKKIETTMELAEIVKSAVPKQFRSFGKKVIHPATKTFQALRIAVNDELGALKQGLQSGYEKLSKHGMLAVISFHSLEDRIVKDYFRNLKDNDKALVLTKKPITAIPQEIAENPRSRSAKLRIIQKN